MTAAAPALLAAGVRLERAEAGDLAAFVRLQQAAYARNRALLGVEPLPLLVDYAALIATHEIWVARSADGELRGGLVLEARPEDLLLYSISVLPGAQAQGLGKVLLAATEGRARQLGRDVVRLYTGSALTHLVAWYERHGYVVEGQEQLPDRSITHMVKRLDA